MECMEARALKSSFLTELAMKPTQQILMEDLWCVTGIHNVSSDDFSVDDLLDFSDKDFQEGSVEYSEEDEEKECVSVSSQELKDDRNSDSTSITGNGGPVSFPADGELTVPMDDLENLEWLSQFVDDSASDISFLCPTGIFQHRTGENSLNRFEPATRKVATPFFPTLVPAKSRSKRSRSAGRVWSLGSPSLTDSSSTSSSLCGSSSVSTFKPDLIEVIDSFSTFAKPPAKKQKKRAEPENWSTTAGSQFQRKCSHCQVQKTPQWRSGPLGPKTLCNACGVRYKSGRLFPEYRPACSPTFSVEVHSNSHRKVLQMRKTKEMIEPKESGSIS